MVKSSNGFKKSSQQVFKSAHLNIHITDLKHRLADTKAALKEKENTILELQRTLKYTKLKEYDE